VLPVFARRSVVLRRSLAAMSSGVAERTLPMFVWDPGLGTRAVGQADECCGRNADEDGSGDLDVADAVSGHWG
jgi:hypothetical protein